MIITEAGPPDSLDVYLPLGQVPKVRETERGGSPPQDRVGGPDGGSLRVVLHQYLGMGTIAPDVNGIREVAEGTISTRVNGGDLGRWATLSTRCFTLIRRGVRDVATGPDLMFERDMESGGVVDEPGFS